MATAACLIGATAYAQTTDTTTDMSQSPPPSSAPAPDMNAPTGAAANTSATVDAANGAQVIASQPVPDTAANRAAYGQPLSRAGKRTAPRGN
jgi:hypothetical protein